jgi:hypothetical protein
MRVLVVGNAVGGEGDINLFHRIVNSLPATRAAVDGEPFPLQADLITHIVVRDFDTLRRRAPSMARRLATGGRPVKAVTHARLEATIRAGPGLDEGENCSEQR